MNRFCAVLCVLGCLVSCGKKAEVMPPETAVLYVALPGALIIDVAAGSNVYLDPDYHTFALYTSPELARAAIRDNADVYPPQGGWKVFRLDGKVSDLAKSGKNGGLILAAPARVADWDSGD